MRKFVVASLAALLVSAANAGVDPYIGIKTGYAITSEKDILSATGYNDSKDKVDQDNTWGAGIEIGIKMSENWRIGFERNQLLEFKDEYDGKWNVGSWMLNAYFEPQIKDSKFYLLATVGLGYGTTEAKWGTNKEEESGMVTSVGLGLAYKLDEHFMFDLMWRYSSNPTLSGKNFAMSAVLGQTVWFDYETHKNEILMGARYLF